MKFQQFWQKLSTEIRYGRKFTTLTRKIEFEASMNDSTTVAVMPSTEIVREIPMEQFQGMWDIMKDDIRTERYVNTNKRYYSYWSSSYISALIDHVVQDQDMQ